MCISSYRIQAKLEDRRQVAKKVAIINLFILEVKPALIVIFMIGKG